jgi:antitoxin MazE
MLLEKCGDAFIVRVPAAVVEKLGLKEGDAVELRVCATEGETSSAERRQRALTRIRSLSRPLPVGWKFDRGEANER